MNSIIETWNAWAEHLPGFAWPMLWQSSLLIAAVFALDLALRRRVRAAVRYALWLIVLAKLVLPPSFASPASLAYWIIPAKQLPAPKPAPSYIVTYGNTTIAEQLLPVHSVLPVTEPEVFRLTPTLQARLLICWTVAGLWLAGILCRRTHQVRQRLTRAEVPADDLSGLLEKCRRQLRLRRPVRLRISADNTSPAVCGLFRPVILLPRQLTTRLNQSQMRAVLLHELIHLKRGDMWVNCVQTLLQIFYWWHPLLWLANARIRRVREEAVDDAVMLALADDAETYAPTLLEVAKLAFNRPLTSLGLVGILESRSALRQRIERLMDFRPPRNAGLTIASAVCVLAFAVLAVPMGEPPARTSPPLGSDSGIPHMESSNSQTATASHDTNSPRSVGVPSPSISANVARPRSWYEVPPGPTNIYSNKVGADGTVEMPQSSGQTETPEDQLSSAAIVETKTDRGAISKGRQNILDKLDRIRLPSVAYDRVSFTNVVRELSEQTRMHDPAGHGVNFIVNPNVPPLTSTVIDSIVGDPLPGASRDIGSMPITINPPLTNVRLGDALDAVVKAADKPIQYSIEDYALVFSLKAERTAEPLFVRTFKVDTNRFLTNLRQTAGVSVTNDAELISLTLRRLLSEAGVELQPPQSLYFNSRGMLLVRTTLRDLDRIEEVVQKLNYAPPHIHIKAKFIELPEQMASSLLQDFGITNSGDPGSWSEVLTTSQMREMTRQFEAQKGVGILTAPAVTTVSGRQAQIQAVDMRTVMSSTNGVMQTNTVPCGSVLNVLPTLGADGYKIQITAIPSVTEFLGYDDPSQLVPQVPVTPSATGPSPAPVSVMPLPHFRVRQVTKSAALWDGQTLVIGGLSATNVTRLKDKVPVLGDLPLVGRAFRKESVGTETNTLLVFITARLIDATGNPIHRDDQMPFNPSSIPPQPQDSK
ncbi:MAG: M48 family metalloprotease [Verrucomicrobiae bacterium]|nr:M48 family metalloprotease [Verrucomicrobiae bacterium]